MQEVNLSADTTSHEAIVQALQEAQARVAELEADAEATKKAAPVAYLHDDGYWTPAKPGQGLDCKRPITRLPVFVDAPAGSGGWKQYADRMEKECGHWKTLAETMRAHACKDVWYWQGDGSDNPKSMVNSLAVVIRADQLRDLLAQHQAQPADALDAENADRWAYDQGRLAERERICTAIKTEDDYCVDQGDYMLDSDDCIKVARGTWLRPTFDRAAMATAQAKDD